MSETRVISTNTQAWVAWVPFPSNALRAPIVALPVVGHTPSLVSRRSCCPYQKLHLCACRGGVFFPRRPDLRDSARIGLLIACNETSRRSIRYTQQAGTAPTAKNDGLLRLRRVRTGEANPRLAVLPRLVPPSWVGRVVQEFPVDARCAPAEIGQAHFADQADNFAGDCGPALRVATLPTRVQPEPLSMPSDGRFGLHNHDRGSPTSPDLRKPRPKESVTCAQRLSYNLGLHSTWRDRTIDLTAVPVGQSRWLVSLFRLVPAPANCKSRIGER